jgi:hypothetical protein
MLTLLTGTSQSAGTHVVHAAVRGGVFATAGYDTLHLEGTWPSQRVFRLFVTDVQASPLPVERMRDIRGEVVDGDRVVAPLLLSNDGEYFEARIEPKQPPLSITVALRLSGAAPPERVAFTFAVLSVDEAALFEVPPTGIPTALPDILALLRVERAETQRLADGESTRSVYVEIVRVRDLALALESYVRQLPPAAHVRADTAIRAAVRASWLLHLSADNGLPQQTQLAVKNTRDAVDELVAAFTVPGR